MLPSTQVRACYWRRILSVSSIVLWHCALGLGDSRFRAFRSEVTLDKRPQEVKARRLRSLGDQVSYTHPMGSFQN